MKKSTIIVFVLAVLGLWAQAVGAAGVQDASVTVYNSGQTRVVETRTLDLPGGAGTVMIAPLPASVDPASFRLKASGLRVLSQSLSHEPLTETNLLDRYVGRQVTVILPDPADAQGRVTRQATLLASGNDGTGLGQPIFLVDGKVYLGVALAVILPAVPEGMSQAPAMVLEVRNSGKARKAVELSYDFQGLGWSAAYTLVLPESGGRAALSGWAELNNGSDTSFEHAALTLVAGQVRRQNAPRMLAKGVAMAMDAEAAPPNVAGEQFSEYRIYRVPDPVDIPARAVRLVSLFGADSVAVRQEISGSRYADGRAGGSMTQNLEWAVILENTKKNGLGMPLPAGIVRAEMAGPDGASLPVGQARINHTPEGGEARLVLGSPFDLTATRVQTAYRKVGKTAVEVAWTITVTNGSDTARDVLLKEMFSGDWTVLAASVKPRKPDARTAEFALRVPPAAKGGKAELTYSARIER